jgi:cytochrome c oxidase subunit 2
VTEVCPGKHTRNAFVGFGLAMAGHSVNVTGANRAFGWHVAGSAAVLAVALVITGCGSSDQSTLSPHSDAEGQIATSWWVMLTASAVIFGVVCLLLLRGALRRRGSDEPEEEETLAQRRGRRWIAIGGVGIPFAVLVGVFAITLHTLPATSGTDSPPQFTVNVTARQWFWDVSYPDEGIRTANEIHIPTGVPVRVQVESDDVVHSFWVPSLNRKIDAIPGHTNSVVLEADQPGTYRGICAEYCGTQHARMGFEVIATDDDDFQAWLQSESKRPAAGTTTNTESGEQVFMSSCVYCHRIAGTNATGTIGPDLSHIASRSTLGAATVPNSRGNLAGWILDPQHLKPGNKMPGIDLSGEELQNLLDYLETLR